MRWSSRGRRGSGLIGGLSELPEQKSQKPHLAKNARMRHPASISVGPEVPPVFLTKKKQCTLQERHICGTWLGNLETSEPGV